MTFKRRPIATSKTAAAVAAAIALGTGLATAAPAMADGKPSPTITNNPSATVLFSPGWNHNQTQQVIFWSIRPHEFQVTLSLSHGRPAGGPGHYVSRARWSNWTSSSAYGHGTMQSGIEKETVKLGSPQWTNIYGGWRYFGQMTETFYPHGHFDGIHASRWSWSKGEWVIIFVD
jgi:hypothetical protein